jgi:hypothetical protein
MPASTTSIDFLTADGQGHMRRSGAEYGSPLADSAVGSATTSPGVAEPTQTFTATRGGSPRVASATAWSAVGGTAPDRTGVNLSGAETSVGVAEGSFASTGGCVECTAPEPGPVEWRAAGPGASLTNLSEGEPVASRNRVGSPSASTLTLATLNGTGV